MPNCAISIPDWETSGRLMSSTPVDVQFSMIKNDTLYFELSNTQTVYMYFNLQGSGRVNYMISIYNADDLTLVSTVTSTSLNLSTNIDLFSGTYIVCLRSLSGTYTGTAKADYYGYGRVVTFKPEVGEAGSYAEFELKTEPRRKQCEKDMTWTLVDGKLPIGLNLDTRTGLIFGRLPYLDCIDDPDDVFNKIPSANLFYSSGIDKYETVEPWGRRWNFKLRIAITDQPEHFDEKWFCLLIYNNWTRTQEKFFREYENGLILGEIIKDVDQEYQIGLCDNVCSPKETDEIFEDIINDFINSGIQIEDEDVLHIDIPDISDLNSENPNYVNIYTRNDNNYNKKKITIENDGVNLFGAYTNHQTTIEMDDEILNQRNVYVPEVQQGFISDEIMIELNSFEEYLDFRQYARIAMQDPKSNIYEYRDDILFNAFMNVDSNVKYEYITYDPEKGVDGVEDSTGLSEKVQHYIYIHFINIPTPEVDKIEEMNRTEKLKVPQLFNSSHGEAVEFNLTAIGRNNEFI